MKIHIPDSVRQEHKELHGDLEALAGSGGKTGEAAKAVGSIMAPHFVKEETYALPPLGILASLAEGTLSPDMAVVLPLTDRLKTDYTRMIAEHRDIVTALGVLIQAAQQEGRYEAVRFAERLEQHARMEEEVTYPAAILIGEYLRLVL